MTVTITYATETNELNSIVLNDVVVIARYGEEVIFLDSMGDTHTYYYANIIFSIR